MSIGPTQKEGDNQFAIFFSIKTIAAMVLFVIIAICCCSIFVESDQSEAATETSGSIGDGITWSIDSQGNLLIEGSGQMGTFGYDGVRWGGNVVRSVTVDEGITSIGYCAFKDCTSLTSVNLPNTLQHIGANAFLNCSSLEQIVIPNSVTILDSDAFCQCTSLSNVILGNSVESINYDTFGQCTSLISISFPNSLKYLGNYSFQDCYSLESITFGNSLESIGDSAFTNCNSLTEVHIPASVKSIGYFVFFNCSNLTRIDVDPENESYSSINGVLFNASKTVLMQYPEKKTEMEYTVPDTVTEISDRAFYRNSKLALINIGSELNRIGEGAFQECSSLITVNIANDSKLNIVGGNAFYQCNCLINFDFPSNLKTIGYNAFSQTSLTVVHLPNTVTSIGSGAFDSCTALKTVRLPETLTEIPDYCFAYCNKLTNISIPDGITTIHNHAFAYTGLNELYLPDSVRTLEYGCFQDCYYLNKIRLSDNLTSIPDHCFAYCGIHELELPQSVTVIGKEAFLNCSLINLDLGSSLQIISDRAFNSCWSLKTIHMPDTVMFIGKSAFEGCSIESIYFSNNLQYALEYSFDGFSLYESDGITPIDVNDLSSIRGFPFAGNTNCLIKNRFTVTTYLDDSFISNEQFEVGQRYSLTTKVGHSIEWESAPSLDIENNSFTMPSSNVIVRGISTPLKYTVTVFLAGGTIDSVPVDWELTNDLYTKKLDYGTNVEYIKTLFSNAVNGDQDIEWVTTSDTVTTYGLELSIKWVPKHYTVTWCNEDGTILESDSVESGMVPTYLGSTPIKNPSATKTYLFSGWDRTPVAVSGPTTYYARYTESDRLYNITVDIDGSVYVIQSRYGMMPEMPSNPSKPSTTYLSYAFEYWTPSLQPVTGDAAYTAVFSTTPRVYTVTWQDDEGNILDTTTGLTFGSMPMYTKGQVTKNPTAEFTYVFDNWTPQVKSVSGDATYTAVFTKVLNTYEVKWVDDSGTILEVDENVAYGTAPTFNGNTPIKYPSVAHIYTFAGWEGFSAGMTVSSNHTFTAVFVPSDRYYTVSFNADGNVTSNTVKYNTTIELPSEPTRDPDEHYLYAFAGWRGYYNGLTATQDLEFVAEFEAIPKEFDITFTSQGEIVKSYRGTYGSKVIAPTEMPTKAADNMYQYVFIGWEGFFTGITTVTGDMTFNATFSPLAITHLIQFTIDGSVHAIYSLQYGAEIPMPDSPIKEADNSHEYRFVSWGTYYEGMTVTGPMTFNAVFIESERLYDISFVVEGESTVQKMRYGETIVAPADPIKTSGGNIEYVFSHWNGFNEGMTVTGNMIFNAVFNIDASSIGTTNVIILALGPRDLLTLSALDIATILDKMSTDGGLFSIDAPNGNIAFDSTSFKSFLWEDVSVSIEDINDTLTEAQKGLVGDRPVYDISVRNKDGNIHNFTDGEDPGKLNVSVRYDLRPGEDPDHLSIWYMNNGKLSEKRDCRYYEKDNLGYVEFTTEHLSNYVVMYEDASNGSSSGESINHNYDGFVLAFMAIAIIATVVSVASMIVTLRRH